MRTLSKKINEAELQENKRVGCWLLNELKAFHVPGELKKVGFCYKLMGLRCLIYLQPQTFTSLLIPT